MNIATWMTRSGVAFGTSGARGLVSAMTDAVCFACTLGYLKHMSTLGEFHPGCHVALAGDLRPSTPRILRACGAAIAFMGGIPLFCGFVPTPALCSFSFPRRIPSLMVTGSHIPADRNGIKFNRAEGEFLKEDENKMRLHTAALPKGWFDDTGALAQSFSLPEPTNILPEYYARYRDFFGCDALSGLTLGVYQHSAVGRDCLPILLNSLGATVITRGRTNHFVPVDTEAVRPEDVHFARDWARNGTLNAILTTDGDSDRPLLADQRGEWLRGDVLGLLTAHFLKARAVTTPINSNTALEKAGFADKVIRTRIGSPYVVHGMTQAAQEGLSPSVGYEANGGFLLASSVTRSGRSLSALPTRDALLPLLCTLMAAREYNDDLTALTATIPSRFTLSDRRSHIPCESSSVAIMKLRQALAEDKRIPAFEALCGHVDHIDETDGLRLTFENGDIIHIRPSGNAPELRVYVEAETQGRAASLLSQGMTFVTKWSL